MSIDPQSLTPVYVTEEINQPLTLYEGDMKFIGKQGDRDIVAHGTGVVKLNWFPTTRIKYSFESNDSVAFNYEKPHVLELVNLKVSCKANATKYQLSVGIKTEVSGFLHEPAVITSNSNLSYVIFHLTNFHSCQLLLESNGWKITIAPVEKIKELTNSLEDDGGYAITHVAKLEKSNKHTFTSEEALDILSGLSSFLSFARGLWVGLLLPIGFNAENIPTWEIWYSSTASAYQRNITSWFPVQRPENLTEAFVGFMNLWEDSDWQQPLQLAIHWYVESNLQAGAIEGSIILTHSALELLYEHRIGKYINDSADKKLVKLFEMSKLPTSHTDTKLEYITDLLKFAEGKKISIPKAITEVRNRLTHLNQKKKVHPTNIRKQSWRLSLWYLELVLLDLFNYQGVYKNRLRFSWDGDYDELPKGSIHNHLV
ncbi:MULTISPECIES: hypothetical protein [Pseudanabaena]|jgi:hypothetical protein|uniref:hypothetical protein n=1 Tax=Pseudanabaena TaxID=1152 RepID=UPI00247969DF|nr:MULTISPECIES: hypothetical protein [Pseudanabaena]MEA5489872.1 hypothetical protein [Pseudanabaena sp. CCNP1317]WGS74473.1 hypothetical protein OA858_10710 [Pseudanabaena galeata CCNP1313]